MGRNGKKKIEEQLGRCDLFLLLVSTNSMGSDFILDRELAPVKARRERGEPVHIYPILLEPTSEVNSRAHRQVQFATLRRTAVGP